MTYPGMTPEEQEAMAKAQADEEARRQAEEEARRQSQKQATQSTTSTWKPDFTKDNPYEGMPSDYAEKIYGTQAYQSAVNQGWIQPISQPASYQPTTTTMYIGGMPVELPKATAPESKQRAADLVNKIKARTDLSNKQKVEVIKEAFASGKVTSSIPFSKKYYDAIDFGNTTGRAIWRALTPYAEEKGETAATYIKAIPSMYTGDYDTQERLKERYDSEQNNPLWTRILLGGDTVYYDEKNGNYISIIAGEAPLISPAKGATTLVKTIPVNYNKILDAARTSRLASAWDKTLAWLKAGERVQRIEKLKNNAQRASNSLNSARLASAASKSRTQVSINRQIREARKAYIAYQAAIASKLETMREAARKPAILVIPGMSIDPRVFNNEIAKTLSTMSANQALRELNKTGLTATFALSHPEIITRFITEVQPRTQTKVITDIEEITKQAAEQKTLTKTQQQRVTELLNKIKTQTETKTETKTQPQEETETKTQTETETKTKTKTTTPTKQETPKPPQQKGKDKSSGGSETGAGGGNWRFPKTSFENKAARNIIKNAGGAIAWRQGRLNKKDIWYVVIHPYTSDENLIILHGKQPEAATIMQRGKRSAYGTAQVVKGTAPKRPVRVDSGIADITITPVGERSVKMKVTADPKQETTGDITIGRRKFRRITPKTPKIR